MINFNKKGGDKIMIKCFIFFLTLILFHPLITNAQETNALSIGGMRIEIGMDKSKVMSTLSEGYKLVELKAGSKSYDTWIINEKSKEGEKVGDTIGAVTFEKEKVVMIEKDWGQFHGKEAISLMRNLIGAISNLTNGESTIVEVQISRRKEPSTYWENINLKCGSHIVELDFVDVKKPSDKFVQIDEKIIKLPREK